MRQGFTIPGGRAGGRAGGLVDVRFRVKLTPMGKALPLHPAIINVVSHPNGNRHNSLNAKPKSSS